MGHQGLCAGSDSLTVWMMRWLSPKLSAPPPSPDAATRGPDKPLCPEAEGTLSMALETWAWPHSAMFEMVSDRSAVSPLSYFMLSSFLPTWFLLCGQQTNKQTNLTSQQMELAFGEKQERSRGRYLPRISHRDIPHVWCVCVWCLTALWWGLSLNLESATLFPTLCLGYWHVWLYMVFYMNAGD